MRRTTFRVSLPIVAMLSIALGARGLAQRTAAPARPADVTAGIVTAADALLKTLDDEGRAKLQFPFDGPQKTRWSNFPS